MKKEIEHKMGTKPVGKLMLTIGTPIVFSMMLQAVWVNGCLVIFEGGFGRLCICRKA